MIFRIEDMVKKGLKRRSYDAKLRAADGNR